MTMELWVIVVAWVVMLGCFIGCHVIARKEARASSRELQEVEAKEVIAARARDRQAQAAAKMAKLGIRTLLNGHRGWAKVNPMSAPPEVSKVIRMRGRR